LASLLARFSEGEGAVDLQAAHEGFLEGGNDSADIGSSIVLFRMFGRIGPVKRAIAIWTEGDTYTQRICALGIRVRQAANNTTLVPTDAQLNGDFTGSAPLFNPYSTVADQNNNIVMRTSDTPQGAWSTAKVLMGQQNGGIYAPMMHPWSPSTMGTGTDLYWNLSLWSEYNVMLMRTDPFREFDRLAQQVFGTAARPSAMAMDAVNIGAASVMKSFRKLQGAGIRLGGK